MTRATMTGALLALLLSACSGEDKAALCRAIGETRESVLQPRDRLFWDKECGDYRLELERRAQRAEEERVLGPDTSPCVPSAPGKVWTGPCRADNQCSSCRCVAGECVAPGKR